MKTITDYINEVKNLLSENIVNLCNFSFDYNRPDDRPHYGLYQNILYERLQDAIKITSSELKYIQRVIPGIIDVKVLNKKKLSLEIQYDDNFNETAFIKLMNFYGYTLNFSDIANKTIIIEAAIPKRLHRIPKFVYHVIDKKRFNTNKQIGILPRRKDMYNRLENQLYKTILEYPERIYCWKGNTSMEEIETFIKLNKALKNTPDTKKENIYEPIILKIDVHEINKFRDKESQIRFYTDPAHTSPNAIFTMEVIPISAIIEIDGKPYKHNKTIF